MKLNKRLTAIAKCIDDNSNVIDVGCDHALLDIYLVLNKKNINCIASDIKEGPLEQAKKNIDKYKLYDNIKLKLGNGIEIIDNTIDTIVISGMGGNTIVGILCDGKDLLSDVKKIVVSPNNDIYKFRKFVNSINFKIDREEVVEDNDKFYSIIILKKGNQKLNMSQLLFGYNVVKNNDYYKYIYTVKQKVLNELSNIPKKHVLKRLKLKNQQNIVNKILRDSN